MLALVDDDDGCTELDEIWLELAEDDGCAELVELPTDEEIWLEDEIGRDEAGDDVLNWVLDGELECLELKCSFIEAAADEEEIWLEDEAGDDELNLVLDGELECWELECSLIEAAADEVVDWWLEAADEVVEWWLLVSDVE